MINPHRLSAEALAVLRHFVQAKAKEEDDSVRRADLAAAWNGDDAGLAAGLAELGAVHLVATTDDGSGHAVVTAEGAAFFRRYHHSCH